MMLKKLFKWNINDEGCENLLAVLESEESKSELRIVYIGVFVARLEGPVLESRHVV